MGSSIRIGRVFGISIELHLSWLVVAFLIAYMLSEAVFPGESRSWGTAVYWIVGIAGSLLFLGSVLAHELSHSLVASRMGIRVTSITLFVFGGASAMESEPKRPRDEALIAAAGPTASLVIGAALWVVGLAVRGQPQLEVLIGWLSFVNLGLGLFNLVPGFPMDGGRILRALLWRLGGDRFRATRIAASVGQLVGYLIIALGVLLLLQPGGLFPGVWLALIGYFLSSAAEAGAVQIGVQRTLHGIRVRDVMDPDPPSVSPNESLAELVHERMLRGEHRSFLVRHPDGGLAGIVSLADVRRIARDQWEAVRVTDVMTRFGDLTTVRPDDDLESAMRLIQERGVDQLPVVSDGRVVDGLLTRVGIMRLVETRLRLGV